MSDTDDTDILLLIPPNFFLVHSSGSEDSLLESSRTVVHKPPSCTSQVLGKLVTQVHCLENRLEHLEVSAASDTPSNRESYVLGHRTCEFSDNPSADSKCFTFPRRRKRKTAPRRQKRRELSFTSLESTSTYDKDIPPLFLKETIFHSKFSNKTCGKVNDTQSMDGDISSIVSTPSKKDDKLLLHEIDEFLSKVEAYEDPESKYNMSEASLNPEHVIKATGDYFTQKLDNKNVRDDIKLPSGRIVPSSVLDKYIYLVKNNTHPSDVSDKVECANKTDENQQSLASHDLSSHRQMDNTEKVNQEVPQSILETKSPSMRKLNFVDIKKDVQPTSTPKRTIQKSYTDTFKPSSNKIYDRASKILEQYKVNYSRDNTVNTSLLHSPKKDEFKPPPSKPYVVENKVQHDNYKCTQRYIDTIDTDLLSLSDLWGPKTDGTENGKVEEERLKREHCEAMIQELQKKLLDQQERLAVAVKVDRAKDSAIGKLREAWLKITNNMERAEARHKMTMDKMTAEVEQYKSVACDAEKKSRHFEEELYKTLDLAHDYQEKCKQLTKDREIIQENMENALSIKQDIIKAKDAEIEGLKDNYDTILRLNKQSNECTKNLESSLEIERLEHHNTKSKLLELNRRTESIQEETALLIQEKDLLKEKVNEERSRNSLLERHLAEKQNLLNSMEKQEEIVDNEIVALRKQLELQKNELKCHYQRQLEEAVLAKLQEFQDQLDHAEKELENDAKVKENAVVDTFNKQISRIEHQHKLEINVLEEKHHEEMKLYRLQLAQASEKISLLEGKLQAFSRRRARLAAQLHAVMQAQWRQALHILTGHGASASATASAASTPAPEGPPPPDRRHPDELGDLQLEQYIKLLLTKPPNFMDVGGDGIVQFGKDIDEVPTSDRAEHPRHESSKDKCNRKSLNASKPPWKA